MFTQDHDVASLRALSRLDMAGTSSCRPVVVVVKGSYLTKSSEVSSLSSSISSYCPFFFFFEIFFRFSFFICTFAPKIGLS